MQSSLVSRDTFSTSWRELHDFGFETPAQAIPFDVEIVLTLQIDPELLGSAEETSQTQRRVRGNTALAKYDLVHAACRNADVFREPILRDGERLQKFFEKNLAGMHGR